MSDTLPTHVGFIVDGNRRWADEHGVTTRAGHEKGYIVLKEVLTELLDRGVTCASAYVFSTENWNRSAPEIDHLMKLFLKVLASDVPFFVERNVRLRIIGSRERLSQKVCAAIDAAEAATSHLTGGQFLVCLNYGGQLEIVEAVRSLVASGARPDDITAESIAARLYAPDAPPCDLIVRTSGEQRLSNFMLWRSAYSELLFVKKLWPDMTKQDISDILEEYARRTRRFGG